MGGGQGEGWVRSPGVVGSRGRDGWGSGGGGGRGWVDGAVSVVGSRGGWIKGW